MIEKKRENGDKNSMKILFVRKEEQSDVRFCKICFVIAVQSWIRLLL